MTWVRPQTPMTLLRAVSSLATCRDPTTRGDAASSKHKGLASSSLRAQAWRLGWACRSTASSRTPELQATGCRRAFPRRRQGALSMAAKVRSDPVDATACDLAGRRQTIADTVARRAELAHLVGEARADAMVCDAST